jgi:hypothetical protein
VACRPAIFWPVRPVPTAGKGSASTAVPSIGGRIVTGGGLWPAVHASRQLGDGRADDGGSPEANSGGVVVGEHRGGPPRLGVAPVRPGTDPSGSAMSMCGARRRSSPAAVTVAIRPGKTAVSRAVECQETRALHRRAPLGRACL